MADDRQQEAPQNNPEAAISYRPDLPDWGVYMRWPDSPSWDSGEPWICKDDVELARDLVPGRRVWKRDKWDGEFYWLRYGKTTIRVRPSMWMRVPDIDLEVGQQVELLERHGKNDRGIFRIREIMFSQANGTIEYYLQRGEMLLAQAFARIDLRPTQVQHRLRVGFYQHAAQQLIINEDHDPLDVGDLLG